MYRRNAKTRNRGNAGIFLLILLLLFGVPGYLYVKGLPEGLLNGLSKPVGQIRAKGLVLRRRKYNPPFLRVGSSSPLYPNDVIQTGLDGEAVLLFENGLIVEVPPAAMFRINAVSVGAVDVDLYLGQILDASQQQGTQLRIEKVRGLDAPFFDLVHYLSASKQAVAKANPSLKAGALYNRLVEASPSRRPQPRDTASIVKNTYQPPRLRWRRPRRRINSLKRDQKTALSWTGLGRGLTYVVEVSPQQNFKNKLTERTKRTSTSLRLHKPGTYYVRVRSVIRGRWVSSKTRTFKVEK